MNRSVSILSFAVLSASLLSLAGPAAAATVGYVEAFDTEAAADSWWVFKQEDAGTYYPGYDTSGSDPFIYSTWTTDGVWIWAQDDSSGGAFVGDYAAAGVTEIMFECRTPWPTEIASIRAYIKSGYDSEYHFLNFGTLDDDGWWRLHARMDDADWWSETAGYGALTTNLISDVLEAGVYVTAVDGLTEYTEFDMDNFQLVPEPVALSVLALGAVGMLFHRKR